MKRCTLKTTPFALWAVSACLAIAAPSLHAGEGSSGGFYFDTDLGLNFMNEMPIGSLTSYHGFAGYFPDSSTGVRWDISWGYQFKILDQLTLGPELETGLLYNQLNVSGAGYSDSFDLLQVPLLVNLVLGWHFQPNWVAYAGVGGGLDLLAADDTTGITSSTESDGAFQVKGGVKYKFGSSAVGLGVKYLAVTPTGLPTVGNTAIFASYSLGF